MKMIKFYTIMLWACIAYWGITPQLAAQENLVPEGTTEIKDMEFKDRTDLTEVVIPEGVTRIGKYAFYNCTNMSSIKLPGSLISIDDYAFFSCTKLSTITLPENLETIGTNAFVYALSEQQEVVIPDKVKSIGPSAFGFAPAATRVKLGKSVEDIQYAFAYCGQLESYEVATDNPKYCSADGVLFSKDMKKLYHYPAAKAGTAYKLPDGTTTVDGNFPFYVCKNLETIDLNNVTTIEGFEDYISQTAEESSIFTICKSLKEIKVASGNPAFTTVDGVLFNKEMTRLESYPAGNGKDTYAVPDGITAIRYGAFNWCKDLVSVTFPASITDLGTTPFAGWSKLETITLKSMTPPALAISLGNGTLDGSTATETFAGTIYVPAGSSNAYHAASGWTLYADLFVEEAAQPFEPEIQETTDSTLAIAWEPVAGATGYILDVYGDEEKTDKVASYTFDAAGKPLKATGFSYTVEGLEAGTAYYIETIAIKQSGDETTVLARNTIQAKTTGTPTANETITADKPSIQAYNGQIIIRTVSETDIRIYDLSGHCIVTGKVNGYGAYDMAKGFYVVVAGSERGKVIVR